MRRRVAAALLLLALATPADAAEIRTCFTPGEDCTSVIVSEIGATKTEVLVQAYSFTSPEIVKALADAKQRGVDVWVIIDRTAAGQRKEATAIETLKIAKVPVLIDSAHAIAHNKVMVLDGQRIITGS